MILVIFSIGLSSCGVWYNFKAYFNSYYNAKVLFDQVETSIAKQPKDLFSFFETTIPAQDYLLLNKVVEKCSKILQFDTRSSYFIDALWLSGKSFYYQREYVKAERKFKELLSNVQDPDELLLVNLWLGKTELQLRNFDEGIKILDLVADEAIKLNEDQVFSDAVIKQISFLIYKERFAEAIDRCTKFLGNSTNKEVNAEVSYELGKFYYKNSEYQKAADAFKMVSTYSPTFETEYKSRLEYAKCQMDMGKLDEGMSLLTDLKNKSQYAQYLDEIMVELGTGYYMKKDFNQAMDLFTKVDTVYYGEKSSGVAEYMKAQIYEYHIPNFDSAATYYEMANQNTLLSDEMRLQIGKKLGAMTKYISIRDDIKMTRKGIEYAEDKKNYLRDSILYVEAVYKDTTEQRKKMLAMQGGAQYQNPNQTIPGQTQTGQTQTGVTDYGQNQNTFAGQQIPTTPQASMGQQTGTNQQTKLALSGASQTNSATGRKMQRMPRKKAPLVKPVMPLLKKDSLQTTLSSKLYNYANTLFVDLDLPDSAAYYYKAILAGYPKKQVIPETYYALGTYYLTVDQKSKADSLFKIVYDNYKNSNVSILAAKKLGLIEELPKTDPADSFYVTAEKKYFDKKYAEAISDFRKIIAKYPKSKHAPRSAYYIAFIFENDIKDVDSTTVAYEFLNTAFPTSDVVTKTQKRNVVYQEVKASKKKAAQEKDKAAQPAAVVPSVKPAIKDSSKAAQDSIKIMMQKALQKEALIQKEKKKADSLKAVRDKVKDVI